MCLAVSKLGVVHPLNVAFLFAEGTPTHVLVVPLCTSALLSSSLLEEKQEREQRGRVLLEV